MAGEYRACRNFRKHHELLTPCSRVVQLSITDLLREMVPQDCAHVYGVHVDFAAIEGGSANHSCSAQKTAVTYNYAKSRRAEHPDYVGGLPSTAEPI